MSDDTLVPVFVCKRCRDNIDDAVMFVKKPTGLTYYHPFCFEKEFPTKPNRAVSPYSERSWK